MSIRRRRETLGVINRGGASPRARTAAPCRGPAFGRACLRWNAGWARLSSAIRRRERRGAASTRVSIAFLIGAFGAVEGVWPAVTGRGTACRDPAGGPSAIPPGYFLIRSCHPRGARALAGGRHSRSVCWGPSARGKRAGRATRPWPTVLGNRRGVSGRIPRRLVRRSQAHPIAPGGTIKAFGSNSVDGRRPRPRRLHQGGRTPRVAASFPSARTACHRPFRRDGKNIHVTPFTQPDVAPNAGTFLQPAGKEVKFCGRLRRVVKKYGLDLPRGHGIGVEEGAILSCRTVQGPGRRAESCAGSSTVCLYPKKNKFSIGAKVL